MNLCKFKNNFVLFTRTDIISFCWFLGGVVGFLPLFGWHSAKSDEQACYFVEIMDYNYLVFLYVATIILPALVLLCFYVHIYTVIIRQVRQTVTFNSAEKSFKTNTCSYSISKPNSGAMLRVLGAARKREIKATQNLSIIVIFFMMCWLPLYTINCIKAFCPECHIDASITFAAIILSHLNSAVNPLLYAYNLKDFRAAMKTLILKMIGKDTVPIQSNLNYRFSIASQHRIQTLVERQQIGSRIYVGKLYMEFNLYLHYHILTNSLLHFITNSVRFTSLETSTATTAKKMSLGHWFITSKPKNTNKISAST